MALFDLDGTLSSGGIWNGFFQYHFRRKKRRAWILSFWVMHLPLWLLAKYKLYSKEKCRVKWMEDLSGIFKGASEGEVLEVFHWVADNYIFESLRNDVIEILNQHKQQGDIVLIVSGAFSGLVEIVGQRLGVPNVIGTKLEVIDGKHTGRVVEPMCFAENKVKLLREFLNHNRLEMDRSSSFAYADSIFDASLLKLVANPVATYPDEDLRRLAEHNHWRMLPDSIQRDG